MINLRDIIFLAIALLLSFVSEWTLADYYMNAFYTILGIMFSIALGLLVTFNLQGLTNTSAIFKIRSSIKSVRNLYIKYFALSTIFYLVEKYIRDVFKGPLHIFNSNGIDFAFNFSVFTTLLLIYSILYYIVNFIAMQKLNDDLYDEINIKK